MPLIFRISKLLLIVLTTVKIVQAQSIKKCATWEMMVKDSAKIKLFEQLEAFVDQKIKEWQLTKRENRTVWRIPVVFHVVYNTTAQNVPDWQIFAQLDTLNAAFRGLLANASNTPAAFLPLNGDVRIEFVMASVDPWGNPTNGINRVFTSRTCLDPTNNWEERSSATGGVDPWDPTRYLNIWIINPCGGLLGIATFPGSAGVDPQGVTVAYHSLPGGNAPYDRGRTLVHEVGHFFGLRHPWGDDCTFFGCNCFDDKVGDTPPQSDPTYGCATYPAPDCGTPSKMFVNHMDYSDDACLTMFTHGQAERMRAFIELSPDRWPLAISDVGSTANNDLTFGKVIYPKEHIPDYVFNPVVEIVNVGNNVITSATFNILLDNASIGTASWTGSLNPNQTVQITLPSVVLSRDGLHTLRVIITSVNGVADGYNANDTLDIKFTAPYQCSFSSDFETDPVPEVVWVEQNPDFEAGTNTVGTQTNARTWYWNIRDFTTGINGVNTFSAFVDFYYYNSAGQEDSLESPFIDLRNSTGTVTLTFDVAYVQYSSTTNDGLSVFVSSDSGRTWTQVFNKAGATLATGPAQTSYFIPQAAGDWRTETVDLTSYNGSMILLRFVAINDYGNNLYIDNVSITSSQCNTTVLNNNYVVLNPVIKDGKVIIKWIYEPGQPVDSIMLSGRFLDEPHNWHTICKLAFAENMGTCIDLIHQPIKPIHYRFLFKTSSHPNWQVASETIIYPENTEITDHNKIIFANNNTLNLQFLPINAIRALELTDLTGRKIIRIEDISDNIISLPVINRGLYILHIETKNMGILTYKLLFK